MGLYTRNSKEYHGLGAISCFLAADVIASVRNAFHIIQHSNAGVLAVGAAETVLTQVDTGNGSELKGY